MLYCENYKIASSTWATHLLSMTMTTLPRKIHLAALQKFSLQAQHMTDTDMLGNITSFIIVRDPFQRIFSAYTVSFGIRLRQNWNNKIQDKMKRSYVKKPFYVPSFRNIQLAIKNRFRKNDRPGLIPTFEEFANYLVSSNHKIWQTNSLNLDYLFMTLFWKSPQPKHLF